MTTSTLNIASVKGTKYKFAIVAGNAMIQKFTTIESAKTALESKRSLYQYWAESVSSAVLNTKIITILV